MPGNLGLLALPVTVWAMCGQHQYYFEVCLKAWSPSSYPQIYGGRGLILKRFVCTALVNTEATVATVGLEFRNT